MPLIIGMRQHLKGTAPLLNSSRGGFDPTKISSMKNSYQITTKYKPKLCCLVNPYVKCVGCDIPLCSDHFIELDADHKLPKCPVIRYYDTAWEYDGSGHVLDILENLVNDREDEEKLRKKKRG